MASKIVFYLNQEYEISYEILNNHSDKSLVILHGWGSSKAIMKEAFKNYFLDFNHYYIDLPGFGKSSNFLPLKTKDYAQILKIFFQKCHLNPNIIMGHSFGGKIAVLLECEVILLSCAGILQSKSLKVKTKIALAKLLKFTKISIPRLRSEDARGLNHGMYQTFKNVVNEDFSEIFSNFQHKATIFWGIQDETTPLKLGIKVSQLIPNNRFFPIEGDHFFFLQRAEEIQSLYLNSKENA